MSDAHPACAKVRLAISTVMSCIMYNIMQYTMFVTITVSYSPRFSLSVENERADAGTGRPNPPRETKLSGTNGDRKIYFFPVQLTSSRTGKTLVD